MHTSFFGGRENIFLLPLELVCPYLFLYTHGGATIACVSPKISIARSQTNLGSVGRGGRRGRDERNIIVNVRVRVSSTLNSSSSSGDSSSSIVNI